MANTPPKASLNFKPINCVTFVSPVYQNGSTVSPGNQLSRKMKFMAPVVIVGSVILGFGILLILYGQRKSGLCYSYVCVCVYIHTRGTQWRSG
jgi:hypothetical protein